MARRTKQTSLFELDISLHPSLLDQEAAATSSPSTTGRLSNVDIWRVDRLFVPLAAGPFHWFQRGLKKWELRKYGRQYTEKHVRIGRLVEFRRGYKSRLSVWGRVCSVLRTESLSEIFALVPFEQIIPVAYSVTEATTIAENILNIRETASLIAFEVEILQGTTISLSASLFPAVMAGRKKTTIRKGIRDYIEGPATLVCERDQIEVWISEVTHKSVAELNAEDAAADGYETLSELKEALRLFYPSITDSDSVTIVRFGLNDMDKGRS